MSRFDKLFAFLLFLCALGMALLLFAAVGCCEVYQGMKEAGAASGLGGRKATRAEIQKWQKSAP